MTAVEWLVVGTCLTVVATLAARAYARRLQDARDDAFLEKLVDGICDAMDTAEEAPDDAEQRRRDDQIIAVMRQAGVDDADAREAPRARPVSTSANDLVFARIVAALEAEQ